MARVRVLGATRLEFDGYRIERPRSLPDSVWRDFVEWCGWEADRYVDGFDDGRRQAREDLRRGDI
jgi:hypothetical protein